MAEAIKSEAAFFLIAANNVGLLMEITEALAKAENQR